jgi:hypothetical protein
MNCSRRSLALLCATTLVAVAACSVNDPNATDGRGGASATGGTSSGGGAAGTTGSGGKPPATGAAGTGGAVISTGSGAGGSAGSPGPAGASGSSPGGAPGAGGASGATPTGGSSAGGAAGGGGKPATTGTGGSSGGGDCPRDFLKSAVDAYFKALAAHAPTGLALADTVKITENGKTITVGDGLWKTAGTLKYKNSAYDTVGCNTASEAVVPEGSNDLPVALRLKFVDQKITEIETIAVRPGDYKVSGANYPSKPDAIISANATVMWETTVPDDKRNTTAEMNAWMSKYFKAFPAGVCNTDSSCQRLENGNSPGGCTLGASCQSGNPTGNVIKSHAIFSDVETGVGVGFDFFMGNADMHMFKMYGGKVYAVHAILGAATSTGWDDK